MALWVEPHGDRTSTTWAADCRQLPAVAPQMHQQGYVKLRNPHPESVEPLGPRRKIRPVSWWDQREETAERSRDQHHPHVDRPEQPAGWEAEGWDVFGHRNLFRRTWFESTSGWILPRISRS